MVTECKENLVRYFQDNGVKYEVIHHPPAYTAQQIAAAEHVPGKFLAKVVMVMADGQMTMMVLPASFRVNFTKAAQILGAKEVRLAREDEFADVFPDCEVGAMPPFGNLYGVPVYVDNSLAEDPEFYFLSGTHQESMKVSYTDFHRLVQPVVADFTVHA